MKTEIVNGKLVITLDMEKAPRLSTSGKNEIVASTNGNVKTTLKVRNREVIIGVNAYIPAPPAAK